MDLLEYQAKKIFERVGIPILPSQPIQDPSGLKRLDIPYPVVLKSQVRAGGRGKAGGVRFVNNTIDAIAAAHAIFNLPIAGEYPEVILVESRYHPEKEVFLAILLDYHLQCPVLLGSSYGGIDVERLLENLCKVAIDRDFTPYLGRKLAISMGLKGKAIEAVGEIVEKMYYLFTTKDLDVIEINPLGIGSNGELMALDGKISINEGALKRHPDLLSLAPPDSLKPYSIVDRSGRIAVVSNSKSSIASLWDSLAESGGKIAGWALISENYTEVELIENIQDIFTVFRNLGNLKVIIVNLIGDRDFIEIVVTALENIYRPRNSGETPNTRITRPERINPASFQGSRMPDLVLRVAGREEEGETNGDNIYKIESFEVAIERTLSLAKV